MNYSPINKFSAANAKTELFIKINSVILSVNINSFCPGFNRFGNNSVNYRCPVMLASIFFKHCNSAYFKPVRLRYFRNSGGCHSTLAIIKQGKKCSFIKLVKLFLAFYILFTHKNLHTNTFNKHKIRVGI